MTMHSYIEKWDLHDPDVMPETRTSKLCRVVQGVNGEKAVLKFLKPLGVVDEAGGARILDYYNGVGAVKIIRYDAGAHLLEYADGAQDSDSAHVKFYADGQTLARALELGQMGMTAENGRVVDDNAAARIAADVVKKLHERKPFRKGPEGLTTLQTRFAELFTRAAFEENEGRDDSIFIKGAKVATHLLESQREEDICPLHGDLHHFNIVHSDSRGEWLAIDPKGLIGDKAYDLAALFINPMGRPDILMTPNRAEGLADIFSDVLGYDRARIFAFGAVQATLSASWSLADGRFARAEEAIVVAEQMISQIPPSIFRGARKPDEVDEVFAFGKEERASIMGAPVPV